jgi:glycerol-1-phosphate dehydrogenase [NAD(P)+]
MPERTAIYTLTEALAAATETRRLEIGDVLDLSPAVYRAEFGSTPAVIISDEITWSLAAQRVQETFRLAGHELSDPVVFPVQRLYAEHKFVEQLQTALAPHPSIPVAVGAGTINDLTKLAAHRAARPYMCVATAASMDGYTAFGASITYQGSKQTFQCPAPRVVLADLPVICRAPAEMTASGYADLLAKIPAGADWLVADALGVEQIQSQAWDIVQGRLREMVSDPSGVSRSDRGAIGQLTEGLMLGGFAMQAMKSSRPASGAEHQFSHLWDMQHHEHEGAAPSHGFKVGIGTLASAALYERLLKEKLEELDVDACCAAWPDAAEWQRRTERHFSGELLAVGSQETAAKACSREELREQLLRLKQRWPELRARLKSQLLPAAELKQMLQEAGAPTEPEQIGIRRDRLRDSFWKAYHIRRRFTVLDLAVRLGRMQKFLDAIFGAPGPWPIVTPQPATLEH